MKLTSPTGSKEDRKSRMANLFADEEPQKPARRVTATPQKVTQPTWKQPGGSSSYSGGQSAYKKPVKCAHSHPPLPLGKAENGSDMVIYGGACSDIIVKGVEVSVGLDWGFRPLGSKYGFNPWDGKIEFLFEIVDMSVPDNLADFKQLLAFLELSIRAGKKVHVGCIGGHGRTGLVLSALVSQMLPDVKDAIGYVRENYCHKAVESAKQVQWLHQHFGIKVVKGAKEGLSYTGGQGTPKGSYSGAPKGSMPAGKVNPGHGHSLVGTVATALPGPDSIWYAKPIAST